MSKRPGRRKAAAHLRHAVRQALRVPGPGVVTGASDDDPSGIATYSVTGARTGYGLLWTALVTFPLNAAVQNMCARIGLTTGKGLATVLQEHYSKRLVTVLVLLLLIANAINIGADLAAVAAGIELLTGIPENIAVVPVAVFICASEIIIPYRTFATYLKLLTLVLFAYVADAFFANPDWLKALTNTVVPNIEFDSTFIAAIVAIFGTTISPYLFFWQTSEEVEELHKHHKRIGTAAAIKREQFDVDIGMFLANIIFYFIILTTAATLYDAGIHDIETADQAAEALKPLAGGAAGTLFAIGFIGTGLLAIPVLAASGAYAVAETFGWKEGLEKRPQRAPQFYTVIAVSTFIGLGIALSGVGAIKALFFAAIVNGAISPLLIAAIVVVSNDSRIVGRHKNSRLSNILGWATVTIMGLAALFLAITSLPV